jgi:hypothetical protein
MKSWIKVCALGALFIVAFTSARADVARPKDEHNKPANVIITMRIEPNYKASEAKLLIPRSMWAEMRAQLDGNDAQAAITSARFRSLSGAQTVVAGIFLSLAITFGGVWFARARKGTSKLTPAALCVGLLMLCGTTASIAYANAGPPQVARSLTSNILVPGALPYGVYGKVKVELTDDDNQIVLVLPKGKDNNSNGE